MEDSIPPEVGGLDFEVREIRQKVEEGKHVFSKSRCWRSANRFSSEVRAGSSATPRVAQKIKNVGATTGPISHWMRNALRPLWWVGGVKVGEIQIWHLFEQESTVSQNWRESLEQRIRPDS
jgi:hypothetical protein